MKVFEALGRAFAIESKTAFGLLGDGNMYAMSAYADVAGTRLIQGRHENAVVAMADGYARATGEVALCTVIDGPGITQVPTSLVIAAGRRTPMVLFVGDAPISQGYNIHAYGQEALARASNAEFIRVGTASRALAACREAFAIARVRRRPVVLSVPADIQDEVLDWGFDYEPSSAVVPPEQPILPPDDVVRDLIARLSAAERPVIIAGEGAVRSGAHAELAAFAERFGALTGTSIRAKGYFRDSPYYLGVVGAFASGAARELLVEADLVVGVGAGMGYFTTEGGYLFPVAERVQVDIDPVGLHTGQFVAEAYVRGDAKATIARALELSADLPTRSAYRTPEAAAKIAGAKARLYDECRPSPGGNDGVHPMSAMFELDEALTDTTAVTFGVGHSWAFPLMGMSNIAAERLFVLDDFGVIGQALPTAIGAAVGRPDLTVLCIDGDGSFIMNIQELETAVREQINLAILVINDGGYGAEVHKLDAKGLRGSLTQFGRPPFADIITAFGGTGETVDKLEDLKRAGDTLINGKGVRLLDLWTDPGVASPTYNRLYFGGGAGKK